MTTRLRQLYEVLSGFSTATHKSMCQDLLLQLRARGGANLAAYFADALEINKGFSQIECPFIPLTRSDKKGTNPAAHAMKQAGSLHIEEVPYTFTFLQREVPHLRAVSTEMQSDKGWIDYVGRTEDRPILGEVKWGSDENPFYAFLQLLTYLSEIATANQIQRTVQHKLFGEWDFICPAFDLHIFLANFNDRGEKGKLIEPTRQLAEAFKDRLQKDHLEIVSILGNILCLSGQIEDGSDCFTDLKCRWRV